MIVTCTPNPALDVSYRVEELRPGHTHRITEVHERAGGKGLNVSRVLHELGVPTLAVAPVGGVLGDSVRADLVEAGLPHALLPVAAPTRMTVAVVDARGEATMLTEPGGPLTDTDWTRLLDLLRGRLDGADVLVCSGSLPPTLGPDAYARLVELGHHVGVPVLVDASGPALYAAALAGADLLKPNAAELTAAVRAADPLLGARELRAAGAGAVAVSLGADGMLLTCADGEWRATPPRHVAGNPTGAGDAAVAALAGGFADGTPWPQRLRAAVALSAAAVAAPVAGSVGHGLYAEFLDQVTISEGAAPR